MTGKELQLEKKLKAQIETLKEQAAAADLKRILISNNIYCKN